MGVGVTDATAGMSSLEQSADRQTHVILQRGMCVFSATTLSSLVYARTAKSLAVSVWTVTTLDARDATQLEGMSSLTGRAY